MCALSSINMYQPTMQPTVMREPNKEPNRQQIQITPQSDPIGAGPHYPDNVEPVFGGLWARNVSIGRRAVVAATRARDSCVRISDPTHNRRCMHA